MIRFNNVCKNYNGQDILKDVSFHIHRNEVVGLLGASGSGKSTILKLISGLIKADSGEMNLNSENIAYIFQEHRLIPWKTALENVCFSLECRNFPKNQIKTIAYEYLDKVGLSDFADYYPAQLSGGMCQRVSIARAFAIKPDVLLMDEPFSALDRDLKQSLIGIFKQMLDHKKTLTVLFVTHQREELTSLVNKIYTLHYGGWLEKQSTAYRTKKRQPKAGIKINKVKSLTSERLKRAI